MSKKPIIFWGATGQARVLNDFVGELGFQLIALFENNPEVKSPFEGIPIFYKKEGFEVWRASHSGPLHGLIAIGGDKGEDRLGIQAFLALHRIDFPVAVHPRADVSPTATVGAGSQILSHAIVAANARIGRGCIINHNASVDHETALDDGVHVGPGATVCGCVNVGRAAFVGAGAVILPRIRIGAHCIVGAGSVVTRDIQDDTVVVGNPARSATLRNP